MARDGTGLLEAQRRMFVGDGFVDGLEIARQKGVGIRDTLQFLKVDAIRFEGCDAFVLMAGCVQKLADDGAFEGATITKMFALSQLEGAAVSERGKVFVDRCGPAVPQKAGILGQAKQ